MSEQSADLSELARAHGVGTRVGVRGEVQVDDATLRVVLGGLGVAAGTDAEVVGSLAASRAQWRPLPPVVVARVGPGALVEGLVPAGAGVTATVTTQSGQTRSVRVDAGARQRRGHDDLLAVTVIVPGDLPVGHHRLDLDAGRTRASCPLLVAPQALPWPSGLVGRQAWGVTGGVETVGSARSGASGPDLVDLAEVVSWVGGSLRGDFVVVDAAGRLPAPFHDPARIRAIEVPEAAYLDSAGRAAVAAGGEEALRAVHAVPRSPRRQRALLAYHRARGQPLLDVATWLALVGRHGPDSTRWPVSLGHALAPGIEAARAELADQVDFHRWCQWVADGQLEAAAREATTTGMGLGLVNRISIAATPDPLNRWMHAALSVEGVTLGRPPSPGEPAGAVGRAAPLSPQVLRDLAFVPLEALLRSSLRHHAGLLVADLDQAVRQWWVPVGRPAAEGTWVAQDHEAVLAAIGIAAHEASAAVIADLGSAESWAVEWMLGLGVLPLFEVGGTGAGRQPERYPYPALVSLVVPGSGVSAELVGRLRERGLARPGAGRAEMAQAAVRYLAWMPSMLRSVELGVLADDPVPTVEGLAASTSARRLARHLAQR